MMLPARTCAHGYHAAPKATPAPICSRTMGRHKLPSAVVASMSGAALGPGSANETSTSQQLLQWDKAMIAVNGMQPDSVAKELAGPGPSSQARGSAAALSSGGDADLLWAGYSDALEQVRRLHASHGALQQQVETLTQRLNIQQQQGLTTQHGSISAATAAAMASWQAASFLFLFLCFINVAGFIASLKAGFFMPPFWAAAKPAVEMMWLKGLLSIALPITNTAVILIFCLQAVKAAWACVRW